MVNFFAREVQIYIYVIHSAYAKCRYTCTGVTVAKPNEYGVVISLGHTFLLNIIISKGQKEAVQLRERRWILPRVSTHEAFP